MSGNFSRRHFLKSLGWAVAASGIIVPRAMAAMGERMYRLNPTRAVTGLTAYVSYSLRLDNGEWQHLEKQLPVETLPNGKQVVRFSPLDGAWNCVSIYGPSGTFPILYVPNNGRLVGVLGKGAL